MASKNYTLGRGKVYFSPFTDVANQIYGGFQYLGNTPALNLTINTTMLDHYNSDSGIKDKDASVPLQIDRNGTMTCDDIQASIMSYWLNGTTQIVNQATTTVSAEQIVGVNLGAKYQLGVSAANPAGLRGIKTLANGTHPAVTVTAVGAGGATYAEGTDYTVDGNRARITPLVGGAIPQGSSLSVTYTVSASARTQITSGTSPLYGAMMFEAANPAGSAYDYMMICTRLMADGDFAMKGDTWQEMKFKMEFLTPINGVAIAVDGQPAFQ